MSWKDVRLQVDVPRGWFRLDDVEPLTFEAPSGLVMRMTPLNIPAAVSGQADAEALLGWAMTQAKRSLGARLEFAITACRFGLCGAFALTPDGSGAVPRFWLLASPYHVLLVSSRGGSTLADGGRADGCVASMHLVPALCLN